MIPTASAVDPAEPGGYTLLGATMMPSIPTFATFHRGRPIYRFQTICPEDDEPIFLNNSTDQRIPIWLLGFLY